MALGDQYNEKTPFYRCVALNLHLHDISGSKISKTQYNPSFA